jgi:S-DNA-T family DNA segregation ATPase FtsK/SpoIIIE
MMQYGKDVELHVKRLAQKARSAGIHLIFATQRPSVDIISGVIKANLNARVSYKLASAVDCRTVGIDGANLLLGRGDSIITTNTVTNKRMHSAYITVDEIGSYSKPRQTQEDVIKPESIE